MRVLQACVRYPPARGGVESHVHHLATGLARRGHEVTVATSDLRSEFPWEPLDPRDLAREEGPVRVRRFPARTLPGPFHWPVLRGLAGWLRREAAGFDVLHAHSYGFHHTLAALLAARLAGKPFVLTTHFHPHWSMELGAARAHLRRGFDALLGPALLGGADAIVCVSRAEASLMRLPRPERLHLIPNGVEPAPFEAARPQAFRDRHALPGPAALFVGRLATNKGLFTLLDAWRGMPPDATLLIAGDGHLAQPLAARAQDPELGGRVRLLGALPDEELRQAYAASDLLVLPSEYEAFGIVLLEAMAAGKPVVATRAGGMAEVVEEGRTGLLVPVNDSEALARAVRSILDDPARARAMGREGQRRVREAYTWDAVTRRVEDLYASLARGP